MLWRCVICNEMQLFNTLYFLLYIHTDYWHIYSSLPGPQTPDLKDVQSVAVGEFMRTSPFTIKSIYETISDIRANQILAQGTNMVLTLAFYSLQLPSQKYYL